MDKKKLALIHIIKKELGLSDREYRLILQSAAGVQSAKDLDERGFRKLMRYFVRSRHYRINELGFTLRQKLFIQSLARQLGWDWTHLTNFVHKYYHRETVDRMSRTDAIKLIESLKNIVSHRK